MKRILLFLLFVAAVKAQPLAQVVFVITDPVGACSNPLPLQYNTVNGHLSGCNNGTWALISGGGGGGGTPGGSSGQIQYNNGGSFGGLTNPLTAGGGTTYATGLYCNTGSVSLSSGTFTYPGGTVSASGTASQEFTIVTGVTGLLEFASVQISEHTQFTSGTVTGLTASIGRPGISTNDEMLAQTPLMQSGGDAWFAYDRPQPPILLGSNSYTIVLALRTVGGNVSALTLGQVNYKVCGWVNQ